MKILDVLTAPWAIEPAKLQEIQAIYATHLRGDKIDIGAVEAKLGRPLANEPKGYDIRDGVAILYVEGVMAKRANLFMQISGGVSTELLSRDLQAAMSDSSVHSVIQYVDTPGGTVDGTQSYANLVRKSRDLKPIVTLASGTMASAGYWAGAAASKVYIADETTIVGSIGVVATHVDVSKKEEQLGVKTTEIFAGKYKRISSQYAPLTESGRETMQDQVDYTYSLFVAAIASHRGVSEEKVLRDMADGRLFIGKQAIDAGLVDGVSTLDELVEQLNRDRAGAASGRSVFLPTNPGASSMKITREQLAAESPELLQTILNEGRAQGATEERTRIQAVEGALIPGHEALVNSLKFDGKSSGGDAALAVLAAEKTVRKTQAAKLGKDAPAPVLQAPTSSVPDDAAAKAKADAEARSKLPLEERCKAEWEADASLHEEFSSLASYTAYEKASSKGLARVKSAG
jgi:signal peptide peptidase SppA